MKAVLQNEKVNAIVADDHDVFRTGLMEVLSRTQLINNMAEASNGYEVLEHLKQDAFKIVFMDISMPLLNGEDTTRLVTEKYPGVYVIALSSYNDTFTIRRMFEAGCRAYLVKNAKKEEFTKALSTILKGKKYFNNDILEKLTYRSEGKNAEDLYGSFSLTPPEMKLIHLICGGKMNKQIAGEMNISIRTVEKYRLNAFHKIGVNNVAELMHFAIRHQIISVESI